MKKIIFVMIAFAISYLVSVAQTSEGTKKQFIDLGEVTRNNENFSTFAYLDELLKDVEIVMLGEQSHGEGTTYDTKVKLVKYLHKALGFDLLVFESGFYDARKAWELIENGMDVREAMGHSISHIWSATKEIIPLTQYIEKNKKNHPLKLLGFDCQFYTNLSKKYLVSDLSSYLDGIDEVILKSADWKHLKENLEYSFKYDKKALKRNQPAKDTIYLDRLVLKLSDRPADPEASFWMQTLKNLKINLLDIAFGVDKRDLQMADNLVWLKNRYPDKKIICWGATSHFLYNSTEVRMKSPIIQLLGGNYYKKQPMMGHYLKELYGDKVYTIGFTAYQGYYGLNRKKRIKPGKKGTLEHLLSRSKYDNFLVPLDKEDFKGHKSRPLANRYIKNDIGTVMDAVIFNRDMRPTETDWHFYLMIYPDNKYIKL